MFIVIDGESIVSSHRLYSRAFKALQRIVKPFSAEIKFECQECYSLASIQLLKCPCCGTQR